MAERLWVEIVDDDGQPVEDGREGEIVVTNLMNLAMPFIRYRTGDLGVLAPADGARCLCGLPSAVLRLTAGRSRWAVDLPNGAVLAVLTLTRLIRRFPVERYQIVRRRADLIDVLIRPLPSFREQDLDALRTSLSTLCAQSDATVEVTVTTVTGHGFVRTDSRKQVDFVDLAVSLPQPAPPKEPRARRQPDS